MTLIRREDRAALRLGKGEEGRRAGQGAWWLRQLLPRARLRLRTSDGSQIAEYHVFLASQLISEALLSLRLSPIRHLSLVEPLEQWLSPCSQR
jgi:hypothetical protein